MFTEIEKPDSQPLIETPFGGRFCGNNAPRERISLYQSLSLVFLTDRWEEGLLLIIIRLKRFIIAGQMLLRQDSLGPMNSFLMRSTLRLVSLMVKLMGKIVCAPSLFMETSTKEETTKQARCSLQPIQVRGFAVYCSFDFIKICTAKCEE